MSTPNLGIDGVLVRCNHPEWLSDPPVTITHFIPPDEGKTAGMNMELDGIVEFQTGAIIRDEARQIAGGSDPTPDDMHLAYLRFISQRDGRSFHPKVELKCPICDNTLPISLDNLDAIVSKLCDAGIHEVTMEGLRSIIGQ